VRLELHGAAERFRRFREQPSPQLERSARHGLRAAIPPNERLLALYHPWTSYAAATITGVGLTVSLLVACLAFTGAGLDEAKLASSALRHWHLP
jgi:hypothetical protein